MLSEIAEDIKVDLESLLPFRARRAWRQDFHVHMRKIATLLLAGLLRANQGSAYGAIPPPGLEPGSLG